MCDDVGEALAMAANSVGLKEMPLYEVEDLCDQDWVQQVEVLFYCASVYLCYVFPICKLFFDSFPQCLFNVHLEFLLIFIVHSIQ